jgi:ubiquinone/menaquinone biosynthesis C-methylase UbiE
MLKQFIQKIKQYNSGPIPLVDYLIPFVGDKKEVRIADVGSGPFSRTGQLLDGVVVHVHPMDQSDFMYFWDRYGVKPLFPIEVQDMEQLTYPDNHFDIVHCVNALDHTGDAKAAVKELIRICKPGGWVYVNCALIQRTTRGHNHFWDAEEDGSFISKYDKFNLRDFGFKVELTDNKGQRAYNYITATLQKPA